MSGWLELVVAGASWCGSPTEVVSGPPDPQPIVLGQDATECQYPSAVAVMNVDGFPFCSGTLIHPQVVLLAAHCVDPNDGLFADHIGFGEDAFASFATVSVEECVMHPMYGGEASTWAYDLAFCTLVEPAPEVPIVPVLAGCEADTLVPGGDVTIVGFGMNDEGSGGGVGTKRYTHQTIESVGEPVGDLILLGIEGASACYGDSGGPVFVQLADGSWRVAGAASTTHPSEFDGEFPTCGTGVVYELVQPNLDWLEDTSGYDVTPRHASAGVWDPTPACDAFPLSPGDAGTWATTCTTAALSDPSASCGDPFAGAEESSTGAADESSSGDAETSSGDTSESSDGATSDDGTTTDEGASATGPFDDGTTDGGPLAGDTSGGEGGENDDETSGCGCTTDRNGNTWLVWLVFLAVRRPVRAQRKG